MLASSCSTLYPVERKSHGSGFSFLFVHAPPQWCLQSLPPYGAKILQKSSLKVYAKEDYGEKADEFLEAFPANSDEQAVRSADDFMTTPSSPLEHGSGRRLSLRPDSRRSIDSVSIVLHRRRRAIPKANMLFIPTSLNMSSEYRMCDTEPLGIQRTAS